MPVSMSSVHSVICAVQRLQRPFGGRWIMFNPLKGQIPFGI